MDRVEWLGRKGQPVLRTVTYDKWPGGEEGHLGATNALPGMFHSKNMVVYHDGYFGPRRGIKNLQLETVNGPILGMGWRGTPGAALWWIQGTDVYSGDAAPPTTTVTHWGGALSVAPVEPPQFVEFGSAFSYVTNYTDQTYKFDHLAKTFAAVAASPGGRDITFYGDRMCIGGTQAHLERIFISNVNDPDDWSLAEFFDIPNQSGAVMALLTQRGHLSAWAQNGEWWIVTGAVGTDAAFLRRVSGGGQHPWVANAQAAEVLPNDEILHLPVFTDIPARFNGSTVQRLERMSINHETYYTSMFDVKVLRGLLPPDAVVIFPATKRMGLYYNEMWTFHETDLTLTAYAATDEQGVVFLTDGGGIGVAPKIYSWQIDQQQRPAFNTDTWASVGDDTNSWFDAFIEFPEVGIQDGYECRVRRVLVDFREWDSGSDSPNQFTITPVTTYVEQTAADDTDPDGQFPASSQSYSQFPDNWTAGVGSSRRNRKEFLFGEDARLGNIFQIKVTGIGGVAFSAFHVDYELRPSLPRE